MTDGGWELESFGVNMPGCRYKVQPCDDTTPGAERVILSTAGVLITEKHELRNVFILPIASKFVVVTAVQ